MNSLEEYIANTKARLNENIFSPLFIRLANLYFINEQYDDCISTCTIGLQIFPDYLTARLLLLKALIKLEYINEAEKEFTEIKSKIPNKDIVKQIERNIANIKGKQGQERLFYPNKINSTVDFLSYKNKIDELNKDIQGTYSIDEYVDPDFSVSKDLEKLFQTFSSEFGHFKFDYNESQIIKSESKPKKENGNQSSPGSFMSKINIVTETIADIYVKQGYLKEAFDAYNLLIDNKHPNMRRIQEKLYELERNMVSGKSI
jgi:tetratricopeptide (TPR) repeat protein